ncbi:MAG: hypothetical protein AAB795_00290 [Patescibacteria group bacterium]
MTSRKIDVFDTMLRDGQQASHPMSREVEISIARALDDLGVDILEIGFAQSSGGDFQGIRNIIQEIKRPVLCVLARSKIEDVEAAARSLNGAQHPRIHVFIGASDIHLLTIQRDWLLCGF